MAEGPYIHKARIFDIAGGLGVKLDSAASIITLRTNTLIKKAVKDFRDNFIDAATPAVHIFDLDEDVLNKITIPSSLTREEVKKMFVDALDQRSTDISLADLTSKMNKLSEEVQAGFAAASQKGKEGLSSTVVYNAYKMATRTLGENLGKIFPAKGMLRVSDPETMGLSKNKMVFIAKSFKNLRDTNLNKAINDVLKKIGISESIGQITVLGHTAVNVGTKEEASYRTNTPLLTETLFRLEAGGLSRPAQLEKEDAFVRKIPLFIKHSISISENFKPTANIMLEFGFSFSVGMDPLENTVSGSSDEKRARDQIISGEIFPELVESLNARVSWLKEQAVKSFKNSPTLFEYLDELFYDTAKGNKPKSYVFNETKSGKIKIKPIALPVFPKISKTNNKISKRSSTLALRSRTGQFTSLNSLQAILDSLLVERIKQNMGDGSRRDILNLRTGRFAESVKVERMSQSREGMVTAFYTYMKNPYATFSQGGRQELPKSRDPKLLISKSIREIMAEKVANKLRAVAL